MEKRKKKQYAWKEGRSRLYTELKVKTVYPTLYDCIPNSVLGIESSTLYRVLTLLVIDRHRVACQVGVDRHRVACVASRHDMNGIGLHVKSELIVIRVMWESIVIHVMWESIGIHVMFERQRIHVMSIGRHSCHVERQRIHVMSDLIGSHVMPELIDPPIPHTACHVGVDRPPYTAHSMSCRSR